MAKRKKKARYVKVAGLRVPQSFMRAVSDFAHTPVGRVLIAEALVLAAGALVRKPPVGAAAAAGGAAAGMAGTAAEAVASIMNSAASQLKSGFQPATSERASTFNQDDDDGGREATTGNGARSSWGNVDTDTVRHSVLGEFSGKKAKKGKSKRPKQA